MPPLLKGKEPETKMDVESQTSSTTPAAKNYIQKANKTSSLTHPLMTKTTNIQSKPTFECRTEDQHLWRHFAPVVLTHLSFEWLQFWFDSGRELQEYNIPIKSMTPTHTMQIKTANHPMPSNPFLIRISSFFTFYKLLCYEAKQHNYSWIFAFCERCSPIHLVRSCNVQYSSQLQVLKLQVKNRCRANQSLETITSSGEKKENWEKIKSKIA